MALTEYAPDAVLTAGNTLLGAAPAIADIKAPKVSELGASTVFQCATEGFGSTTNVQKGTRKMLCDRVGKEKVTDRTYGVEKITIMLGNPQEVNALLDTLVLDSKHFLWLRPGIPDDQAIAAGQKVLVVEATVDSVDLRAVSTSDGDEFAAEVSFSVVDRTQLFGTVVA